MKTKLILVSRVLLTLVLVAAAALTGRYLWNHYMNELWTRDGRVRADVVGITPDVSGLVDKVLVVDNQHVACGDVLFTIDTARYTLAMRQAEAGLHNAKAVLDQASRDVTRYDTLGERVVPRTQIEQAHMVFDQAQAAYDKAQADLDLTHLNHERATVTAPVGGLISNFSLRPGDYVSAGKAVTALVDENSFYVVGYFEETKLSRIRPGDTAIVRLMGDAHDLHGRVASIAAGIVDREQDTSSDLLANITPTFSWVRLAQRVPVRIQLENVPADVRLVAGRTATIVIQNSSRLR